ncbi:DUF5789 family protein [Halococcus sediminicola]|uniref:DUF5789 family protein n=1 Tax=Halococcus sediminicola TaxID=1264579 RepID=UPI000679BD3D|nr:hypothetical protein [Halococcus sediminicola]
MADNKKGRDKQADDEERRQRERDVEDARDRADETEPPRDDTGETLGDLDEALENHDYPTTTDELIEAYGDHEVESQGGSKSIDELFIPLDDETYDSPDEVRNRIQMLLNRG